VLKQQGVNGSMSNIRVVRHENNFVQIQKEVFQNKNLSFQAKGFLATVLAYPPDWEYNVNFFVKLSTDGETAVYNTINELINEGYCSRFKDRSENGCFEKTEYVFYETKNLNPNFKKFQPQPGFPDVVNPDAVPSAPPYTTKKLSTKKKKEIDKESPAGSKKVKGNEDPLTPQGGNSPSATLSISFGKFVKMQERDYATLCEIFGKVLVDETIENINDYLISTGKKPYKCYVATCRMWIRRNAKNKPAYADKAQENREWSAKIIKIIQEKNLIPPQYRSMVSIELGKDGISFQAGQGMKLIAYKELGYKDQVLNHLMKMGVSTKLLDA
jgi:hypothetical protein